MVGKLTDGHSPSNIQGQTEHRKMQTCFSSINWCGAEGEIILVTQYCELSFVNLTLYDVLFGAGVRIGHLIMEMEHKTAFIVTGNDKSFQLVNFWIFLLSVLKHYWQSPTRPFKHFCNCPGFLSLPHVRQGPIGSFLPHCAPATQFSFSSQPTNLPCLKAVHPSSTPLGRRTCTCSPAVVNNRQRSRR